MTHSPKPPLRSLLAFAEASAAALGFSPLQPWQKRFLEAIDRKRKLDGFAHYEPERDGDPGGPAEWSHRRLMAKVIADAINALPLHLWRPPSDLTPQGLLWPEHVAAERWRLGLPTLETLLRGDLRTRYPAGEPVFFGIDLSSGPDMTAVHASGPRGIVRLDHAEPIEERPTMTFVPIERRDRRPGHAGYFTTAGHDRPSWVRRLFDQVEANGLEIASCRSWSITEYRFSEDAVRNCEAFGRDIRAIARRVELAALRDRVRRLDRGPIEGAGRLMLEVLIRAEYRNRRAFFGDPWKAAAARYADLQTIHRDLYGVPAEVRQ